MKTNPPPPEDVACSRAFSNLLKDEASGVFLFFLLLTPELLVDERGSRVGRVSETYSSLTVRRFWGKEKRQKAKQKKMKK